MEQGRAIAEKNEGIRSAISGLNADIVSMRTACSEFEKEIESFISRRDEIEKSKGSG